MKKARTLNPYERMLAYRMGERGPLTEEDVAAAAVTQGNPIAMEAAQPETYTSMEPQAQDMKGALHFDGEWVRTPEGLRFIRRNEYRE